MPQMRPVWILMFLLYTTGCEEKHSNTTAHRPVVKPSTVVTTAVSQTLTQQQGWGNYQDVFCNLSIHL